MGVSDRHYCSRQFSAGRRETLNVLHNQGDYPNVFQPEVPLRMDPGGVERQIVGNWPLMAIPHLR